MTIAALLFVCAVGAVYVLAACALLRALLRRAGRLPKSSGAVLVAERLALLAAGAGILCFAYGRFVEPYWPEVTRVRIESGKLPGAARPLRVVHISDLHCDPEPRLEGRLHEIIAAERPDLIVFTGDSLNSPAGLAVLRPLLARLAQVAPTFAVRGNWDTANWGRHELFGGTGVTELDGGAVRLDAAGTSLWVAGVPFGDAAKVPSMLREVPAGAFTIFLYHTPDEIMEVAGQRKVDLYCAGHTHGGQVALPVYGALMTLSKFGKRFEAGLYREADTWLYVNRGVGMEGGPAPRVRFFARPEVTVIEIAPV